MTLTAERARELFRYDPETGSVFRRIGRAAGCAVTSINKDGYIQTRIDGKTYLIHRVIFLIVEGRWPDPTVDHVDRSKINNRWVNLREASHRENRANKTQRPRRLEHRGVHPTNSGRYFARAVIGGRYRKLGTYDTPEQAAESIRHRRAGGLI